MKTAMQELEEKLKDNLKWIIMNADYELMDKLFIKGLEKEKEQILDAHLNGQQDHHFSLESRMAESEDYYNQTYNQNK